MKMKSLFTLAVLLSFLWPNISTACSCMYMGKFSDYSSKRYGVIHARIKSYGKKLSHGKTLYESMVVEVVEIIKGNYKGRKLTLLGDPGHLCRDYVNSKRFVIGSEHLISLASDKSTQPLGGCGESSVIIKGDHIEGVEYIKNEYKSYTMPLKDLVELIKE